MEKSIENYQYKDCFFEVDGPIATFTISNPSARNAYSRLTWEGLVNAVQLCRENDDIRVLVLTGDPAGQTFCAGLNVKSRTAGIEGSRSGKERTDEFADAYTPGSQYARMIKDKGAIYGGVAPPKAINPSHSKYTWFKEQRSRGGYWTPRGLDMLRLPKPVIAMVNGPAVGAGCDLAFHCDVIIASDQARFMWVYIHRGFAVPAEGASYFLPRLCGYYRAMEILFQGGTLTAQQAYDWDIINHVVPHAQLKDYTYDLARKLATQSPPMAMGILKWALQRGFHDYADNLERYEDEIIYPLNQILSESNDFLEGNKSFVEKRKPNYTGT